jgi:ATP-dependent DNA ligase
MLALGFPKSNTGTNQMHLALNRMTKMNSNSTDNIPVPFVMDIKLDGERMMFHKSGLY